MIHLDTSFLIRALVRASSEDRQLRRWVGRDESLAISAVAWGEFMCGPLLLGAESLARAVVSEIVPIGAAESERAAALYNLGGRRRGSLMDCFVAACAIESRASLATANGADFARFAAAGLVLAK